MKQTLENTPNLTILQGEAAQVLTENGKVCGVRTTFGEIISARARRARHGRSTSRAPSSRANSNSPAAPTALPPPTNSPTTSSNSGSGAQIQDGNARARGRPHIDYSKCELQPGDPNVYPFSFLSDHVPQIQKPCYLTYTNERTHEIIRANLHRSPLYSGVIKGTGPRYCPSIEDKVVRFADKERHQLFLEPECADSNEVYVQGMSSSLPHDVQRAMYRTVAGLENVRIMRYAYAIEYDCIDTLDVYPTLGIQKGGRGLYTGGTDQRHQRLRGGGGAGTHRGAERLAETARNAAAHPAQG